MKELTQEVFKNQPPEVDWAGVDFDGLLKFGKAVNPRYTWASERWRGFEPIGDPVPDTDYKPLTQIRRSEKSQAEAAYKKVFDFKLPPPSKKD